MRHESDILVLERRSHALKNQLQRLPSRRPWLSLAIAILAVEIVGASGGLFTARGLGAWYESLQQPQLAPPSWVFGPVWTILFALIGVALWLVWRKYDEAPTPTRVALGVFTVHFLFNLTWSAVFFGARNIGLALVVITVLWILIVKTMWAFYRVDYRAGVLLVPYLLWVTFAVYLNYQFVVLN
jgi:tryptophan-rich sensory protein